MLLLLLALHLNAKYSCARSFCLVNVWFVPFFFFSLTSRMGFEAFTSFEMTTIPAFFSRSHLQIMSAPLPFKLGPCQLFFLALLNYHRTLRVVHFCLNSQTQCQTAKTMIECFVIDMHCLQARHERLFCHMRTTKTQTSLRIRAVWSAPCCRCLDSIISLVSISKISSLYQACLSLTLSHTPQTGFLVTRLI